MKPLYSKVVSTDFANNAGNSPIAFTFEPVQNTHAFNNLEKRIQNGAVQYPMIFLDTRGYEYIKDKLVPSYDLFEPNGQKTECDFDYLNTIPVELYFQICILTTDISELAALEDFIQSFYGNKRMLTIENPDNQAQKLPFEISVCQTRQIKRSQSDFGNDHVYISYVYLTSGICVSFTEKYSPAQLELDNNVENEIIERLAALEDIKDLLLKQDAVANDKKITMLDKAWADLDSLVDCVKGITTYRKLYSIMRDKHCDAAEALTIAQKQQAQEQKRAQEEVERIRDIEKKFSKKGDKVLNRYTDAVVEDIRGKLADGLQLPIYGGSTFIDWYRLEGKKVLEYPNILVYTDSDFTFANKKYTNVNAEGGSVGHAYTQNALPIEYGIRIQIQTKEQSQTDDIAKRLRQLYENEVQICVPDLVIEGDRIPIRLVIDSGKAVETNVLQDKKDSSTVYQAVIPFKKFPSVYYPVEYGFMDVKDDQRLQFRLLQQADFLILCDSKIRYDAMNQLNTDYKNLFYPETSKSVFASLSNAVSSALVNVVATAFDSEEHKAYQSLKTCVKNRQPIERKTFDTAFGKITSVYPLYEKMMQGWSLEQIREDLTKYADIFNKRWNSICNALAAGACPLMFPQLGMTEDKNMPIANIHKGLLFYISKMENDPYCTMVDAKKAYDEQLRIEKEKEEREKQEAREAWDAMMEARQERKESGSSGRFFSNMFSTAGGVAMGNKMSGNSKRKDGKKDLFGTSVCQRCRAKSTDMDRYTCIGCPAYNRCTQQYR